MNFIQKSFTGGMDTISPAHTVAEDGYVWLVNGRNRFGKIEPINKHLLVESAPAGLYQGVYAVGNTLFLFVAGKAYYQVDGMVGWTLIPNFQLSSVADRLYACAVPASTANYLRKASDVNNANANINVDAYTSVNGTPSGVIVQDGINQPWIIILDTASNFFYARLLQTYNQWNNADITTREYVPVGRMMLYQDGILYIVAPDYKSVYRSITGRALDFMINVDIDGNKSPSEVKSGAASVSFAFDYDSITCIKSVNVTGNFVLATERTTRLVEVDYNNLIFGEPRFKEAFKFTPGIVNNESFVELTGNYGFISKENATTFDAVLNVKFRGRNSIFTAELSKYLKDIKQKDPICFTWNNFAFFNMDTTWGNVVFVFDILKNSYFKSQAEQNVMSDVQANKWTGFDITEIQNIKQVAIVETLTASKLFCITKKNQLWQMFGDTTDFYTTMLKTRDHVEQETRSDHKSQAFIPYFDSASNDSDYMTLYEYVDDKLSQTTKQPLNKSVGALKWPITFPIIFGGVNRTDNPSHVINKGYNGKKIHFILKWKTNAKLIEYEFRSTTNTGNASMKQKI